MGVKEGFLRRRVNYFLLYQRCYVVLRNGRLDLLDAKTRVQQSSIALSAGHEVGEVSRPHRSPVGHGGNDKELAFSLMNDGRLIARFMAETEEEARDWKAAIEDAIAHESRRKCGLPKQPKGTNKGEQPEYIAEKAKVASKVGFDLVDNVAGLPVYREHNMTKENLLLKTGCVVRDSADNVRKMILEDAVGKPYEEWEDRLDVLEEDKEKHRRIEHVRWFPINVCGMWTKARDFVLERYWMTLENGTVVITYRSVPHPRAPVHPSYVRGNIWMMGFLITPQVRTSKGACDEGPQDTSCWVDMCVHFDPEGWLTRMPKYFHQRWAYPLLMRLVLLRDAVDRRKYVTVDPQLMFSALQSGASTSMLARAPSVKGKKALGIEEPEENTGTWGDWINVPLDKEPLQVRGPNYLTDKAKIECKEAAFDMVAADLFQTEGRVVHIASRPDNLVHRLIKDDGHPFVFVVHFTLPGPPYYSLVAYFVAKPDSMTVGNSFGDLLNKFLNSESKSFRDGCFKFIPRVVSGNFFVRKAVGTTPAILGKKLAQEYYGDGETYFELVVDVGSSSVAGSILGVVKGYATSLEIDLAFLLEGQEEEFLPEKILGAIRLVKPDITKAVPLPDYPLSELAQTSSKSAK